MNRQEIGGRSISGAKSAKRVAAAWAPQQREALPRTRVFSPNRHSADMVRRGVSLNHVIVWVRKVSLALRFYRDLLGFRTIESMPGYARLRSPEGGATIALHETRKGRSPRGTRQVVLYFETRELTHICRKLRRKGVRFDQLPQQMPWGWDHAYLRDPDGHEISLYWAGSKRFGKTPVTKRP